MMTEQGAWQEGLEPGTRPIRLTKDGWEFADADYLNALERKLRVAREALTLISNPDRTVKPYAS